MNWPRTGDAERGQAAGTSELRLGHIVYSNCFPVHARLIDQPRAGDPRLVHGIPSHLNHLLQTGGIDVAPCSSIEYAKHADRYRILPDLVIGSRGPVRSILFVSRHEAGDLGGHVVAIPTASATSVVLLKILLRTRWAADVDYRWFDQAADDPFASGAGAALFIGDVAMRANPHPELPYRYDLGKEWSEETGLPFAFAVWQAAGGTESQLADLHQQLLDSREYGRRHRRALAERHAASLGLPPEVLEPYWRDLSFDLDETMLDGLRRFYELAVEIGEVERVPELNWV